MSWGGTRLVRCEEDRLSVIGVTPNGSKLSFRKEVIQPQVPLRLPCYDLVPVTELTVDTTEMWRLRVLPAPMT